MRLGIHEEYLGWEHCEGEPLSATIQKTEEYSVTIHTKADWIKRDVDPDIVEEECLDTTEWDVIDVQCQGCRSIFDMDQLKELIKKDMLVKLNTTDPFGGIT